MRWSRLVVVSGLLALALLGAGSAVSASGARPATRRAVPAPALAARGPLLAALHQLQLRLARSLLPVSPRSLPLFPSGQLRPFRPGRPLPYPVGPLAFGVPRGPSGTVCPVAADGPCSLTPCIEFAGAGKFRTAVAASASAAVVIDRLATTSNFARPLSHSRGCQGRLGAPRTELVRGP